MSVDLRIPQLGESITEAFVARWLKQEGQAVAKDETIAELETEKASFELPAPVAGTLKQVLTPAGQTAKVGQVIGTLEEGAAPAAKPAPTAPAKPAAEASPELAATSAAQPARTVSPDRQPHVMPAARHAMAQAGLTAEQVQPTGPGGRILKEDVLRETAKLNAPAPVAPPPAPAPAPAKPTAPAAAPSGDRPEEAVPMSPIRQTIARRLMEAQHNAALLTTFNEVDMSAVMALRNQYKDDFEKKYKIKLGFMSFFVKAAIDALRQFPAINAVIRDHHIVYRNYYDVGVAVSTERGLVVPVIRNAQRLSFAQVELAITDFGRRARDNKLSLAELDGGTFTITNGGIFGSLLSTPIVNPPQSGVLGMHAIQERPVALNGQVVIRPMMYTALTYDHRIVDGREAVQFLKRVKQAVEDPARMLLEI